MEIQKNIYNKDSNIVSRKIHDEVILVPIKRNLDDVNAMYLLQDDVSIRIWELIDGKKNVLEINSIICKEFEVDSEQANNDIIEFFKQLEDVGGIILDKT